MFTCRRKEPLCCKAAVCMADGGCLRKTQTLSASAPRNSAANSACDPAVRRGNPSQLAELLLAFWACVFIGHLGELKRTAMLRETEGGISWCTVCSSTIYRRKYDHSKLIHLCFLQLSKPDFYKDRRLLLYVQMYTHAHIIMQI